LFLGPPATRRPSWPISSWGSISASPRISRRWPSSTRSLLLGDGKQLVRDHRGFQCHSLTCNHLERFELGTPDPRIVEKVSELVRSTVFTRPARLAVDATGVGRAVVDLFLDAKIPGEMIPIPITAGLGEPARKHGVTSCQESC
jgi:hypothetical protein